MISRRVLTLIYLTWIKFFGQFKLDEEKSFTNKLVWISFDEYWRRAVLLSSNSYFLWEKRENIPISLVQSEPFIIKGRKIMSSYSMISHFWKWKHSPPLQNLYIRLTFHEPKPLITNPHEYSSNIFSKFFLPPFPCNFFLLSIIHSLLTISM